MQETMWRDVANSATFVQQVAAPDQESRPHAPVQFCAPFQRITIDMVGPFPRSDQGSRYHLIAMEYFTKWPEAYAIPDQEASTVADALVINFFCRFGIPRELHSDQGRNF
jgi:hypothetical protein